jgi:hypothetical protein
VSTERVVTEKVSMERVSRKKAKHVGEHREDEDREAITKQ